MAKSRDSMLAEAMNSVSFIKVGNKIKYFGQKGDAFLLAEEPPIVGTMSMPNLAKITDNCEDFHGRLRMEESDTDDTGSLMSSSSSLVAASKDGSAYSPCSSSSSTRTSTPTGGRLLSRDHSRPATPTPPPTPTAVGLPLRLPRPPAAHLPPPLPSRPPSGALSGLVMSPMVSTRSRSPSSPANRSSRTDTCSQYDSPPTTRSSRSRSLSNSNQSSPVTKHPVVSSPTFYRNSGTLTVSISMDRSSRSNSLSSPSSPLTPPLRTTPTQITPTTTANNDSTPTTLPQNTINTTSSALIQLKKPSTNLFLAAAGVIGIAPTTSTVSTIRTNRVVGGSERMSHQGDPQNGRPEGENQRTEGEGHRHESENQRPATPDSGIDCQLDSKTQENTSHSCGSLATKSQASLDVANGKHSMIPPELGSLCQGSVSVAGLLTGALANYKKRQKQTSTTPTTSRRPTPETNTNTSQTSTTEKSKSEISPETEQQDQWHLRRQQKQKQQEVGQQQQQQQQQQRQRQQEQQKSQQYSTTSQNVKSGNVEAKTEDATGKKIISSQTDKSSQVKIDKTPIVEKKTQNGTIHKGQEEAPSSKETRKSKLLLKKRLVKPRFEKGPNCRQCGKAFGIRCFRHHCHRCWRSFCEKCLPVERYNPYSPEGDSSVMSRICNTCSIEHAFENCRGRTRGLWSEFQQLRTEARDNRGLDVTSKVDKSNQQQTVHDLTLVLRKVCVTFLVELQQQLERSRTKVSATTRLWETTTGKHNKGSKVKVKEQNKACIACKRPLRYLTESRDCAMCGLHFCTFCTARTLQLYLPAGTPLNKNIGIDKIRFFIKEEEHDEVRETEASETYLTCLECEETADRFLKILEFNQKIPGLEVELFDLQRQIDHALSYTPFPMGIQRSVSTMNLSTNNISYGTSIQDANIKFAHRLYDRYLRAYAVLEQMQPQTGIQKTLHKHIKQAMFDFYVARREQLQVCLRRRGSLIQVAEFKP